MTKAELIQKISKDNGIPDSNAKQFFEIFLKRLSEILELGQAAEIKGLGYFQLRNGKLQTEGTNVSNKITSTFLKLIIFFPITSTTIEENDLIFNIPDIDSYKVDSLDNSFSISISKPVIPLEGVKETEYFTPFTGIELKNLLSSRMEKLISSSKIIKEYAKGNELLLISSKGLPTRQYDLEIEDGENKTSTYPNITNPSTTKNNIEWEFGEELNKQIEEESILDTDKNKSSLISTAEKQTSESIGWNFGLTKPDEPNKIIADASSVFKTIETKETTEKVYSKTAEKRDDDFQKIETLHEKLNSKKNLNWEVSKTSVKTAQITTSTNEFNNDDLLDKIIEDNSKLSPIQTQEYTTEILEPLESNLITEAIDTNTIEQNITTTTPASIEKNVTVNSTKTINSTKYNLHQNRYSKRGTSVPFIFAFIVIIGVGVFLFYYLTKNNNSFIIFNSNKNIKENIAFAGTNLINRNYDIPVSFVSNKGFVQKPKKKKVTTNNRSRKNKRITKKRPIIKSVPLSRIKDLRTSMKDVINATKNNELKRKPKEETKTDIDGGKFSFDNLPPAVDDKINNKININKGNTIGHSNFEAQISSWKSRKIADSEAERFSAMGYDAFVVRASVPGKGIWYRVKIRNFKSLQDAENFKKSNK